MNNSCKLLLILLIFFLPKINKATIINSNGTGGGDWSTADSWSPAQVPTCGDTIVVLAGDMITLNTIDLSGCGTPTFIIVQGTIKFTTRDGKLKLACNSGIRVDTGGLITDPNSNPDSELQICNSDVWKFDKQGDVIGPITIGQSIALPITLLSFDAEIDNTSVKLTWKTTSEINNDYFTIERSSNGLDFEEVAQVQGSGNSNSVKEYEQYDDSPLLGTSYYRLKQTDFDGKFEYVKLIAINFNQNSEGICTLKVYPNPCVGSCTIDLKDCPLSESQVDIELYDAFGKKIVNRITPKSQSKDISFHLNPSNNLAPGVYIVRAKTNGKNQASKVIIK